MTGPRRLALVALSLVAVTLLPTVRAAGPWGRDAYEKEKPVYQREVDARTRALADVQRAVEAKRAELDEYLASFWSASNRNAAVQSYERSADHGNRRGAFEQADGAARAARKAYDRHLASGADERSNPVRAERWMLHLQWLDLATEAARRELAMLDARLVGIQGKAGFDWEEFMRANWADLTFVFRETAAKVVDETWSCLVDSLRSSYAKAVRGQATSAVADTTSCLTKIPVSLLTTSMEMTARKNFLDRMVGQHGVLVEVADYWWSEVLLPEEESDPNLLARLGDELSNDEGKAKLLKTFLDQELEASVKSARPGIEKAMREARGGAVSVRTNATIRKSAEEIVDARLEGLTATVDAAELGINLSKTFLLLLLNSDTFHEIEANEVGKYRQIVDCLKAQGRPVEASTIIALLRDNDTGPSRSVGAFRAFLGTCKAATTRASPSPGPPAGPDAATTARVQEIGRRMPQVAAGVTGLVQGAEAACDAARSSLAGAQGWLQAFEREVAQLASEAQAAQVAAAQSSSPLGQAKSLAADAAAAGQASVGAKQTGEAHESTACTEAAFARSAGADNARFAAKAEAAARQAAEAARTAHAEAARARQAADQATALRAAASGDPAKVDALTARAGAIRGRAPGISSALAEAAAQAQRAQSSRQQAVALAGEAASLLAEARRLAPGDAALLRQLQSTAAQADAAARAAADCDVARDVATHQAALQAAEARLTDVDARLRALRSLPGAVAPPELDRALADARASADTAELFADAADAVAARAAACAKNTRGPVVPPPPPPSPGPVGTSDGGVNTGPGIRTGPGTATDGWAVDEARTIGGGAPPADPTRGAGPAPGGPDVSGLVSAAVAAAGSCRYGQAVGLAQQILQLDPGNGWAAANGGKLVALAQRQRATIAALSQAQGALSAGDFKAAQRAIGLAGADAPGCMRDDIAQVSGAIAGGIADDRARRDAANRAAAAGLLGTLINVYNQGAAPPPPPGVPPRGGGGGGSTGTAGASGDPCASRYRFANEWTFTPTCDCAGYTWNGVSCVGTGGGGGGGAPAPPDIRTVECGSTTKSGADAPATITVNMGGRPGQARFSWEMFGVKDRMIVQAGGATLLDTGCVGGPGSRMLPLGGGAVTVIVQPACETSGTQWNFTLECPR